MGFHAKRRSVAENNNNNNNSYFVVNSAGQSIQHVILPAFPTQMIENIMTPTTRVRYISCSIFAC